MKLKKTMTSLALALWMPLAASQGIDTSPLDAHQFNLGMVGFAGHISEAELKMKEIERSPEANAIFLSIIDSPDRSNVAKLYSLCGLKRIKSPHFKHALDKLSRLTGQVSAMHADVMKKEDIKALIHQIKLHRCQPNRNS